MSDLYTELLVKRETPASEKVLKVVLIAATVLSAFAGIFITPLIFILFIGLAVLCYFKLPAFDLEFEYLYVNGELDVDKIMSKSKRKRAASYDIAKMELLAPWNSHELDYYKQGQQGKSVDFSSGKPEAKVYGMVYKGAKGMEIVLLELDGVILEDIKRIAPRKVKLY